MNGNNTRDVMRFLHRKKPVLTLLDREHFNPEVLRSLKRHFLVLAGSDPAYYALQSDCVWVRLKGIGPELKHWPNLKLVACNMTDVSHLPLEECQRRGIEVLSLKCMEGLDTVHATAEHTISLMLQALRHRCDRSSGRIGRELLGKRVLCVGYGRIAAQVCRMLEPCFGCIVDWFGPQPTKEVMLINVEGDYDIVSIHASLNETSKGMVNAEFLSKLKPGCILVNTARDAIVDHREIMYWLERDQQAIYAHDFSDEWPLGHERIIATPHIGGWTIESLHKTEELLAERVIEWAKQRMEVTI